MRLNVGKQMNSILNASFEKMYKRYTNILSDFYPAKGSTGFTESNLVHLYINSLTQTLKDEQVIEWMEFPWIDKKQHIDGMIYSPKYEAIFYIEAKRFSHKSKVTSISNDIKRIIEPRDSSGKIIDRAFVQKHFTKYKIKYEYIIILADLWVETTWKKSIPQLWTANTKENNIYNEMIDEVDNIFTQPIFDWDNAEQLIKRIDINNKESNYFLLMSHKLINQT